MFLCRANLVSFLSIRKTLAAGSRGVAKLGVSAWAEDREAGLATSSSDPSGVGHWFISHEPSRSDWRGHYNLIERNFGNSSLLFIKN